MSYRILFITPHLSTGGCPQYLLKKIQLLNDLNDVYCVEYNDHGEWFNIQKTQIRELLGSKYRPLKDNKKELLSIISEIKPDIIHLEEMPEYYMDVEVASEIYRNDRKYFIVETSHDSSFDSATKKFFPDRFVFVSEYQKRNVERFNIQSHVIEYPILIKERKNRIETLLSLGLDPNMFHILNVGLFSPRKNQAEIIEYARKMTDKHVQFHFIGNIAGNFQQYWEPLLKNLPTNCKLWGERSDVDTFFSCMDLFLFTSRGTVNDKETSPIVIREAISYKIPTLIYNLPVYLGMYDKYSNIQYLDWNVNENVDKIEKYITNDLKKDISYSYVVSSYPVTDIIKNTTLDCLNRLTNSHRILVTHYNEFNELEKSAETVVYDPSNPIIKHSYYSRYWYNMQNFKVDLNLKFADNDNYHGLAVWTNYQNGIRRSNELGYKYSVCMNFDMLIDAKDLDVISDIVNQLETSKKGGFFMYEKAGEGDTLKTVFFVINNQFFINNFDDVRTPDEYQMSVIKHQSPSNSLENYVHSSIKNKLSDLIIVNKTEQELLPNSKVNLFSCVDYFSVVPVQNDNKFVLWKNSSNLIDNRNVVMDLFQDGKNISTIKYIQSKNSVVYGLYNFEFGKKYNVTYSEYNSDNINIKNTVIDFGTKNDISESGVFQILNTDVPPYIKMVNRLNLHHFSNNKESVESVSSLINSDVIYRKYEGISEMDVVKMFPYYSHENHLILKNVKILNLEEFAIQMKLAREYMYDNDFLLFSFEPNMFMNFNNVERVESLNVYLINNNYLSKINDIIKEFNPKDCLTLFNDNLSTVQKCFVSNPLIKVL